MLMTDTTYAGGHTGLAKITAANRVLFLIARGPQTPSDTLGRPRLATSLQTVAGRSRPWIDVVVS